MIVTVFRSRLRPGAREEYIALVDRMVELARQGCDIVCASRFMAGGRNDRTVSGLSKSQCG